MKNNILSLINKDIISLILAIFFSSIIFLSNDSKYVEKIEQDIIDFVSIISSPKKWYKEILIIKEKNDLLIKKITQLQLLVATYDNYRLDNEELKILLHEIEEFLELTASREMFSADEVQDKLLDFRALALKLEKVPVTTTY